MKQGCRKVCEVLSFWGEPRTMARVQGLVEECFPRRRGYTVWTKNVDGIVSRHVAVRFDRDATSVIECNAPTWTEAILAVCEERSKTKYAMTENCR